MHKKGTQWDRKMSKIGVNRAEVPQHVQVWESPPLISISKLYQISSQNIFKILGNSLIARLLETVQCTEWWTDTVTIGGNGHCLVGAWQAKHCDDIHILT